MVSPLTAHGWAHLLQWLDDFVPGQDERPGPPRFDSPECQALRISPEGEVFQLWLALESHGVSYEAATELWKESTEFERTRVYNVLFGDRRTKRPAIADDSDISETWCGKGLGLLAQAVGLKELGNCTLDQIEWLLRDGDANDENPAYSPERLKKKQEDMMTKWGDKLRNLPPLMPNGHKPGETPHA